MLCLSGASPLLAQDAAPMPPTIYKVMGQPPRWKPYLGASAAFSDLGGGPATFGGYGMAGLYKDLINPLIGVGISAEGYMGSISGAFDGGGRLNLALPVIFLQAGIDYEVKNQDLDFILSFSVPIRRGGILGHGSLVRLDWIPGRNETLNLGFQVPVFQPWAGKTRPKAQDIVIPRAPHDQFSRADSMAKADPSEPIAGAVAQMRIEALWLIDEQNVFYQELAKSYEAGLQTQKDTIAAYMKAASRTDAAHPNGWNPSHEVEQWHTQMTMAFGLAAGGTGADALTRGAPIAAQARRALLDSVLIPYDSRFGQYKDPNQISGYGSRGRLAFEAWLSVSDVTPSNRERMLAVWDGMIGILEQCRRELHARNQGDSRLNWMPMQLALEAKDHDTQGKVDNLIERVVDRPFMQGNGAVFMLGMQFQLELANQIASARSYHVLWTHDYRGIINGDQPDSIGAFQTLNYLRALTRAAERYDSLGTMPRFFIFNDQLYYIGGKSQIWLDILQNPLGMRIVMPQGYDGMQARLVALQDSLKAAVKGSKKLQALAKSQGNGYLEKLMRVNISVTQPSDLSYRSTRIIGVLPIVGDNVTRDHRKISFFDLSEDDPSVGRAAYTGVGVGESYADATWDDRVLVVAGPAVLSLKFEAQRELLRNGFKPDQIPEPLRPRALAPDYAQQIIAMERQGYQSNGIQVHNDPGFGWKRASIMEMMLITLMPPGSVIMIPDSLWTSLTYAAHLVVAALRGCQVYLIAPAYDNAPSKAPITMTRNIDIFGRLLEIQKDLAPEMAKENGSLRIGIYTRTSPVNNVEARYAEVAKTFNANPWLQRLFLLNDTLMADLNGAAARLKAEGYKPQRVINDSADRKPRLHAKTQWVVTGSTLQAIKGLPNFQQFVLEQFRSTREVLHTPDNMGMPGQPRAVDAFALARAFDDLTPLQRDSSIMYLSVGSMNKDTRGLFLDGETDFVIGGAGALQAYTEMFYFFGVTTWVETQEQLAALFPHYSQRQFRMGYRLRKAI